MQMIADLSLVTMEAQMLWNSFKVLKVEEGEGCQSRILCREKLSYNEG